ncbi:MAG: hypothetical protein J6K70_02635 [Selenomonadales bacterium]|nr:hypothetical protein [Selenomonadales bacterium]
MNDIYEINGEPPPLDFTPTTAEYRMIRYHQQKRTAQNDDRRTTARIALRGRLLAKTRSDRRSRTALSTHFFAESVGGEPLSGQ